MKRLVVSMGLALLVNGSSAADFFDRELGIVRGPDSRPCVFFTLKGVAEADPAVPGTPWFTLRKGAPGFKENFSLLTMAKVSGRSVNISTTGQVPGECGQVEAFVVMLP